MLLKTSWKNYYENLHNNHSTILYLWNNTTNLVTDTVGSDGTIRIMKHKHPHIKKFLSRPLSWSSINSFQYDKNEWYEKYINGKKGRTTGPLVFGKNVGERLASEPQFLPGVPRLKEYEHELNVSIGKIPCIGFLDNFDLETKTFSEFKTGKKWTQDKANKHGQLDMYAAMIYLKYGIRPEDLSISLIWLPTEEQQDFRTDFVKDMKPIIFEIRKSMRDILSFMAEVQVIHKEMQEFILSKSGDNIS